MSEALLGDGRVASKKPHVRRSRVGLESGHPVGQGLPPK